MEPVFRQSFPITAIHLDRYGRLKPSALLFFAQEAAGGHCKELALDWDTLAKHNLFWAVIRHRVQISRLPVAGETITVETWPMPTTRSAFPRATVAYDARGNEVFRTVSLWVLMDTVSRGMVLPGKSGVDLNGTLRGCELATPTSILPKPLENTVTRRVGYTELDRNGHMNNSRYMDWIDDLVPSEFHGSHPVRDFTVCYLSEATEGQEIHLSWQILEGGCLQVDGRRSATEDPDNQTRVFAAQVYF
jgi:acyl-ACP thioesterase